MDLVETKNVIINSFYNNKNSHAFLFVTNNIEKCAADVIDIIKNVNCINHGNDGCNICSTIESSTNPDVIRIVPDGREIKVDSIASLIASFSTKPLINKYSMYVIEEADKLNMSSSNKILKFLEEPEENIVGFFITEKLQGILPTIRSRCEIINYKYENSSLLDVLDITENEYAEMYDKAFDLLRKLNDYPKYILMSESKKLSELERDQIDLLFKILKQMYTIKYQSITSDIYKTSDYVKVIIDNIDTNDLKLVVKRIRLLDNIMEDFKFNLNKELTFNRLFLMWE
jgi:DNA polymerase-3 subunit delta'